MSPCAKLCVLALLACAVNSAPVPEEESNTQLPESGPEGAVLSSDGFEGALVPSDAQVTKRQAEEAAVDDAQTPEGQGLEAGQNSGAFFAPEQGAQDPATLTQESSQFNAEAAIPQGQEASVSKRQADTAQVEGQETSQQDAQFVQPEGQVGSANDESQVAESSLPQQEVTSVSKRQVEQPAEVPQADGQPAEVPPADEQPAEVPQADGQPAEVPQADEQPAEVPQADGQSISAPEGQFFAPLNQEAQSPAEPTGLTQDDSQVAAEGSIPQEGQTVAKRQVQEAQSADAGQAPIVPDLESQSFEGAAVEPQADAPAEIPTQDEVSQGAEDAQSKLTKRQISPDPYNVEVLANKDRKEPCVVGGDVENCDGFQAGLRQAKSDEAKRPKRQGSFASASSGTDYGGFGGYGGGSESEAQSQSASFSLGPFQASFSESEASSQSGNQGYNNYGGGYGNGGFNDY
nr:PREDICTED: retinitis pigmentosa 1-like 1 protein isoform X2 [Bemisia tabaci]